MKTIVQLVLLVSIAVGCLAQSQAGDPAQQPRQTLETSDTGVVPLARPYAISTAPHFAVLVQFPRADSIRRIAWNEVGRKVNPGEAAINASSEMVMVTCVISDVPIQYSDCGGQSPIRPASKAMLLRE